MALYGAFHHQEQTQLPLVHGRTLLINQLDGLLTKTKTKLHLLHQQDMVGTQQIQTQTSNMQMLSSKNGYTQ